MCGISLNATAVGIRTVLNAGPASTTKISLIGHADDMLASMLASTISQFFVIGKKVQCNYSYVNL